MPRGGGGSPRCWRCLPGAGRHARGARAWHRAPGHAGDRAAGIRLQRPPRYGGVSDILVRIFESRLRERLGQPLYVEPRPGGGGLIAAEAAMRANDAHSFTVNHIASHGIGPSLYRNRGGFDPLRDMPGVVRGSAPCRTC